MGKSLKEPCDLGETVGIAGNDGGYEGIHGRFGGRRELCLGAVHVFLFRPGRSETEGGFCESGGIDGLNSAVGCLGRGGFITGLVEGFKTETVDESAAEGVLPFVGMVFICRLLFRLGVFVAHVDGSSSRSSNEKSKSCVDNGGKQSAIKGD